MKVEYKDIPELGIVVKVTIDDSRTPTKTADKTVGVQAWTEEAFAKMKDSVKGELDRMEKA